jgi:uncharacterized protein (DUF885 family)
MSPSTAFIARLAMCLGAILAAPGLRAAPAPSPASAPAHAAALHRLFDEEWERGLRESPESASYQGDTRYDELWTDLSPAAIATRAQEDRAALARLLAIDRRALSSADQLDYDTFRWQIEHQIERQRFHEELYPIGHQGGVQTADGVAETMPFDTVADYRRWLARMAALPVQVDQVIVLLRQGLAAGRTPPRVLMERVPAQIAAQVVADPAQSPFFRPFLHIPNAIDPADRTALAAQAQATIRDRIVPAYRRLQRVFNTEYLPRARASIAVTDQPDGAAYYDFLARYYTTTDLSVSQIHAIGLAEVARLQAAMEALKTEIGFQGDLQAFFGFLRTDPRFFYATPEALLEGYRAVAKRIDPELVKVFRIIPRLPYGVRPIPANIAPDTTTAYYQGGAADGTRPGYFCVNLYRPEVRPKWEMLPLALHESVPGHHFQFARALELPDAPLFRRTAYFVAYSEGWGLYAEQLGREMGLYEDPYDRFGQLSYEMWRAVRLVVDTGMHAQGWSREQAIDYFMAHTPKTRQDVVNEIDRYIGTPGQALAYKIGQMKISALRAQAQQALGPKFDLRDFNDAVLATGSVPLAVLQTRIEDWIAAQRMR